MRLAQGEKAKAAPLQERYARIVAAFAEHPALQWVRNIESHRQAVKGAAPPGKPGEPHIADEWEEAYKIIFFS